MAFLKVRNSLKIVPFPATGMLCPSKGVVRKDEGAVRPRRPRRVRGGRARLLGGQDPLSPSAPAPYWACQVSDKNPRAEGSLQTGHRGWPGAVGRPRSAVGGCSRPGGASPPPRTGHDAPEPRSLDVTPLGTFRKGLWCRTGWSTSAFRTSGWFGVFVALCQLR